MSTRLDRLIGLLETGSNHQIKSTAARQIGELAKRSFSAADSATAVVDAVGRDGNDEEADVKPVLVGGVATSAGDLGHGLESDAEWKEVMAFVGRILPHLKSKSYDTRIAASLAIDQIARSVPIWSPPSTIPVSAEDVKLPLSLTEPVVAFDLANLLLPSRPKLLASSGKEFAASAVPTTKEEIEEGKREVLKRLGIGGGGAGGEGMDMGLGDLVKEELDDSSSVHPTTAADFIPPTPTFSTKGKGKDKVLSKAAQQRAEKERLEEEKKKELEEGAAVGLSARQINALKRKRKIGGSSVISAAPPTTKPRLDEPAVSTSPIILAASAPLSAPVIVDPQAKQAANAAAAAAAAAASSGGAISTDGKPDWGKVLVVDRDEEGRERWPFERLVDVLSLNLFSPSWEVRHGASMALRDLIKRQGSGMGKIVGLPADVNSTLNSTALLSLSHSLLTLLALDRFGDYNSDQVVAPVRETCSQTLAAVLRFLSPDAVRKVHDVLVAMVRQGGLSKGSEGYAWEARHAGLLGLKYEVAVRRDLIGGGGGRDDEEGDPDESMTGDVKVEVSEMKVDGGATSLLKEVVDAAILGLSDMDDDVRSVSASCLLPIAATLGQDLPDELNRVVSVLWDALGEGGDELGSSTGGVMELLGKLITFPQCIALIQTGPLTLVDLVPRLYPFFRHTISSVRLAVPTALHLFLTSSSISNTDWIDSNLLRLLFQNIIVEANPEIKDASLRAWRAALARIERSGEESNDNVLERLVQPWIGDWLSIAMSPPGVALDAGLFYKAVVAPSVKVTKSGKTIESVSVSHNVDKNMMAQDLTLVSADEVLKGRLSAAQALASILVQSHSDAFQSELVRFLIDYLGSTCAHQIIISSVIVEEWCKAVDDRSGPATSHIPLPDSNQHARSLSEHLIQVLEGQTPATYYEMLLILSSIHADCQGLLSAFISDARVSASIVPALPSSLDPSAPPEQLFSIAVAGQVASVTFDALLQRAGKQVLKTALPGLRERQMKIVSSIGYYTAMKDKYDQQVMAAVAGAVISLRVMPSKLNPVIRSIMNGVKFEENLDLQTRFGQSIASFIVFCSSPSSSVKTNPTDKIVKNLCTFVCQDATETAVFAAEKGVLDGILTLKQQTAAAAASVAANAKGAAKEGPIIESDDVVAARVTRRGAHLALGKLAQAFGPRLFTDVPKLWSCMTSILLDVFASDQVSRSDAKIAASDQLGQDIVDTFTTLSAVTAYVDPQLHPQITYLIPIILFAIRNRFAVIRHAAAKSVAIISDVATVQGMKSVVELVLPYLGDPSVAKRQGAVEVVAQIVKTLDAKALPYVLFLIVPILGRMSDPDDDVRLLSTSTFAALVKMVPLEAGIPDPPGFSAEMLVKRAEERQFLSQLLDGTKVEQYDLPIPVKAELRKYQQDGINWLAFLSKYQLHGILCDDMGLGKSLQSLCILASKHFERAEKHRLTGSPDSVHLPSIIICPPSLTGHWFHEIPKFVDNLRPVIYAGNAKERARIKSTLRSYDVVISSYEVVRNDVEDLSKINWHYCILDEGHVIKNGKTKLTQAVKALRAQNRLILSGTPIQNNVLELWSLFDFLMPGFLGTERSFNERFGKPITANRDGKGTAREREAGTLALEALHKQVLPFLLRRLKEDVLSDLPPKIIQDYYCDLSDVQKQLYDDFSRSEASDEVGEVVKTDGGGKGQGHVFQSLQYLRKLCNHPCLVSNVTEYAIVSAKVKAAGGTSGKSLRDIANAPKLQALKQILHDCGIGTVKKDAPADDESLALASMAQHRVLIFCQLKTMLDVIEHDLFKNYMPSVTYMRMDGSTDPSKRHGVVQTFNSDPSIDVLLLTTQVGGLGLNLTGADTVIFVEHDWNPMKDLQAMDRAHRLGQKKVVNVYRLITKGTLEEKIMGLQRFKLNIANSVVNQQNAGLESMGTDQVLDLFKISTGEEDAADAEARRKEREANGGPVSQKSLLDGLEDLPNEDYANLGVDSFLEGLS